MAEFHSAKRQASQLFAQAVCDAGWALNSMAAQTVAGSHVTCLALASLVGTHASMWLLAAVLASAGRAAAGHQDTSSKPGSTHPVMGDLSAWSFASRQLNVCILLKALDQLGGASQTDKLLVWAAWCNADTNKGLCCGQQKYKE